MPQVVTIQAPAKLNLALSVGPRDASAMHPICSWMIAVDLCDELNVSRLEPDRVSRYAILWHAQARRRSEINWPIAQDLAVRAHLAMEQHVGRRLPLQLRLEKRIPVGGGLGGGSSDAAAMLHAVNQLFDLRLGVDDLADIGLSLGSDVPFLVHAVAGCHSAIVEGLGDRIHAFNHHADVHAVLVLAQAACPTGQVYAAFDELSVIAPACLQTDRVAALARSSPLRAQSLFNDLTSAALRIAPSLEHDMRRLSELAGRPAHLSGSGSTLFALCDNAMESAALAASVERSLSLPATPVRCAAPEESRDRAATIR